ncbi:hypothetical protein Poli38472_006074 [Pythium oligandrum]|uniref:E3 ubiquitin protein ligase n=1 Tax=Pythium oligandrum TaxID=41045 RepID=A0A8K1CU16_PYTOL|nr:hypothetical protein Poli38472_006074 [Pythium oligandrum]|eukprot:TMW68606.1 hypothetical protein Poli38472_006074 [Pythium oligandrum]
MAEARSPHSNGSTSAKKRREVALGGGSPVKKLKLDDDEPPVANPNSLEAVRDRNKAMGLDLLEKNRRIAFLTQKCESLFQRNAVTKSAFRCIQRQWLQLLDDVHTLTQTLGDSTENEWKAVVEHMDTLGVLRISPAIVKLELPEWFVAISNGEETVELPNKPETEHDVVETSVILTEKEKAIEVSLQEEHERVKTTLQKLLERMPQVQATADVKQIVKEKCDSTAEALRLKDELEAMKEKIAELQADLEHKEAERHRACRNYDRLSQYVERQREQSAPSDVKSEQPAANGSNDSADEEKPRATRPGEKRVTLQDATDRAPADRETEKKLRADLQIFNQKLQTERATVNNLRREIEQLRAAETAWQKVEAQLKQEYEDKIVRLQEESTLTAEELSKVRHKSKEIEQHVHEKWKKKLDKMQADVIKAKTQMDEITVKNAALREKLSSYTVYRDQVGDLKSQHESLKRENGNLKKQVENVLAKADRAQAAADNQEIATLRAQLTTSTQQSEELKKIVDELRAIESKSADAKLSGAVKREEETQAKYTSLQAQHAEAVADLEKARIELEDLKATQDAFREENDALVAEIESVGKEVEAARHSKKKVIHQLEEKRNSAKKLQSQLAKESDAKAHCFEELAAARLQVSSLSHVHKQQKATLDAAKEALKARETELDDLKKYVKQLEIERDVVANEKLKVQREADIAKQLYNSEASQKQQQQILQDKKRSCEHCESHRKKAAELEKRLAATKAASGSGGAGGEGGSLSELERFELVDLQKQLKCSVCQDRHKDVIISKCFHMFCKECVDNNLKSRNRKCPTCKKMFGQDDVKNVWFT